MRDPSAPQDSASSPWTSPVLVAAVAFVLRASAALLSPRVVADVLRYHRVAAHVLDVSWNPYLAARLYPYPPVWIWVEVGAEWLARHTGLPFALAVKAPVVLVDALLAGMIASWARSAPGGEGRARWSPWAGWVYALHPVALLVTGFHGQFDALPLLALLAALRAVENGRPDRGALLFAAAVALKPFPVLVLPFALLPLAGARARLRFLVLALVPVGLLLLPFAIADLPAMVRELLAYGGIPDFGWTGALRALEAMRTGRLSRATAGEWAALAPVSKIAAPAAIAALWWAAASGRLRMRLEALALAVLLSFEVFYGALSAQYLLWPVPLAVRLGERFVPVHALAATAALVGFYLFLAPGVLSPAETPLLGPDLAQRLWTVGTALTWAVTALWLADLVRRGWRRA